MALFLSNRNIHRFCGIGLACLGCWFGLTAVGSVRGQDNGRAQEVARQVGPQLRTDLEVVGLQLGSPVFLRIFKEERELELWVKAGARFKLFRKYHIAAMSGHLGPKLAEGDQQAPEGFYYVARSAMKPDSLYHLAFNIGFPNAYDRPDR